MAIGLDVPSWHLNATFYSRKYKSKVLRIYNFFDNEIDNVIEIGCGSGELINRLRNSNKLGIDIDKNVLKLCRRIHPKLDTVCLDIISDFQSIEKHINKFNNQKQIFIIMVNWLHNYSNDEAKLLIKKLLSFKKEIILLVDIYERSQFSIKSDNKVKHNFSDMNAIKWFYDFPFIDEVRDFKLLANYVPKVNLGSFKI